MMIRTVKTFTNIGIYTLGKRIVKPDGFPSSFSFVVAGIIIFN